MSNLAGGQQWLEDAYRLQTPDDSVAYYKRFAEAYDAEFVEAFGYVFPEAVAEAYRRHAQAGDVPIADIGCGTGAVALHLGLPAEVDGVDISPDMLRVAEAKRVYRALYSVDLTGSLDAVKNDYGAVVSAGTFTHGHLGPGPLIELLGIARRGALFIIGVNEAHFSAHGFGETLDAMANDNLITPASIDRIPIYDKSGHQHAEDHALILEYRKL